VILGEQDIEEFDELKKVLEVMTRRLARITGILKSILIIPPMNCKHPLL